MRSLPGWENGDQWALGQAMFYGPGRPFASLLMRARGTTAALSVLLGIAIFAVARRVGGDLAALAAAALWAFDPLAVAHAGLATTDLGAAAFYFAACALAVPAMSRGRGWTLAGGAAAGLALASKFSNAVVLAVLVAAALAVVPQAGWKRALGRLGAAAALAAAVLAATYGPAGPRLFLEGFQALGGHEVLGHPAYAFGRYGEHGWAWYFPAAWLVKTPVPILVLTAAGVVLLAGRLRREPLLAGPILLPAAAAAIPPLFASLNLGVRHLLPVVPFLAVAGGYAAAAAASRWKTAGAAVLAAMGVWLAVGTLRVHPDELAYANEPSGGPDRLWTRLADSNVDWGQALPQLAERVSRAPVRTLWLAYFGTADPGAYGLRYTWLPSMRMIDRRFETGGDPGGREWVAISVTHLLGVYDSDHGARWAWLRERPMTALCGRSIALYDVTGDAGAILRLGRAALEAGDPEAALPALRRAADLAPGSPEAREALARAENFQR